MAQLHADDVEAPVGMAGSWWNTSMLYHSEDVPVEDRPSSQRPALDVLTSDML